MKTSTPALAEQIHSVAAPVFGGDIGAEKGKLAIMVGSDEKAYHKIEPLF